MRTPARWLPLALALCACSSEENTVLSGYPPVIISPVRSSVSAQVNYKDNSGTTHPQWVIAMTDTADLCTKVTQHPDYFQNPIENFDAAIVWIPPGNLGTYLVGQNVNGSVAGNEVLAGVGSTDGGAPRLLRLSQVVGVGATVSVSQFNTGAGGEARGSFDVAVFDPGGNPREFVGRFKATYCTGMESAQLP
jgi:hypothetical protein